MPDRFDRFAGGLAIGVVAGMLGILSLCWLIIGGLPLLTRLLNALSGA